MTQKTVLRTRGVIKEAANKPAGVSLQESSLNLMKESGYYSALKAQGTKEVIVNGEQALRAFPILAERYKNLGLVESLHSGDAKQAYTSDYVLTQMGKVMYEARKNSDPFTNFSSPTYKLMEEFKKIGLDKPLTESINTTTSNILSPAQAIVDMVGIFTPQSVIHHMCDPISVPRMTDIVYRLMPKYSETAAGVIKGQTLFQEATNGTYASVYRQTVVPTVAAQTAYTITLQPGPATPNTIVINAFVGATQVVAKDDGFGNIVSVVGQQISGTIDYGDGVTQQATLSLTFATAPDVPSNITVNWNYNYEADDFNNTLIRSIYIDVDNVDIRATAHPLRITVSAQSEFELKSLADYSMISAAQEAALGLISNERDIRYINTLIQMANTDPLLNFDAAESQYYPVSGKYSTFETKVNYARSLIQKTMGRGTVTNIIGGTQLCDIVMYCPTFQAVATEAPIGPHLFGTLQDGAVKIIKNPYMAANQFVIYFKGYGPGDNPVLYASWLDLYVTPDIQMYDFNNYQSLASFYDMKVNEFVRGYVWMGFITNYQE